MERQYNGINEKLRTRSSEAVNRGRDNTMVLKKQYQRGNEKRKSRDRQYNGIKEKLPKRSSEAVNQGTENTMVLKKQYQRGNQKP